MDLNGSRASFSCIVSVCVYMCECVCMSVCVYMCECVCMSVCVYMCECVCVSVCVREGVRE